MKIASFLRHNVSVSLACVKGKVITLQAWTGREDSKRLRIPVLKTIGTGRWEGCQPYAPVPFTPQEIFLVIHFFQRLSQIQDHSVTGRIMSMKNSNDTTGNRTPRPSGLWLSASTNCATASLICVALRNYLMNSKISGGGGGVFLKKNCGCCFFFKIFPKFFSF